MKLRPIWGFTKLIFFAFVETCRIIPLAIIEIVFTDRERDRGRVPRMENPPSPPSKRDDYHIRQMRRNQKLLREYQLKKR